MAKGYIIASVNVTNPDAYAAYAKAASAAVAKFGGTYLVRGGRSETLEGTTRTRNVVLEFPDYQTAHDFYHSPDYTAARALRLNAAEAAFLLVEGA
ncbi:MAG: DUF1330 domain-containing protein [Hyphomicrobiales bacterium]|nr:DUF1330 domain-containing protein [Hyphomicrobiales bacterium]